MTPDRPTGPATLHVHTFSPDDRARVYNEGFDEGWGQAHEDLTRVISVLENYGDHHEWCKSEPGFLPCECGYERELHELRGLRDQVKYPSDSLLRNAAEEVVAAAIDYNETLTRRQSDAIGALDRALHAAELPYIDEPAARKEGRGIAMTPEGTPSASSEDRTHEPLVTARRTRATYLIRPDFDRLEDWCRMVRVIFGSAFGPYLVGSAIERPDYRDVDIRVIVQDRCFDSLFRGRLEAVRFLNRGLSVWGRQETGLPIDCQVQRQTEANAEFDGPRHAMGVRPTSGVPSREPGEEG